MGTRSLTHVFETYFDSEKDEKVSKKLLTMYRQYDGYPSGMGMDLVNFLKDGIVVNGISVNETRKVFNGAGCLSAQLVAHFKTGSGGIYIQSINDVDCWQDYEYNIIVDFDSKEIIFECIRTGFEENNEILFSGNIHDFEKQFEEIVS
jgi:hypothetical protein